MKPGAETIICRLKPMRQLKGWSQTQLAERIGVKRQAIYDIESGKYIPNTALALGLARELDCKVEDLFHEKSADVQQPVTIVEANDIKNTRVEVTKIRGQLVGYPLGGKRAFDHGFRPADGILTADGKKVQLLYPEDSIHQSIVLLGCDPAFSILGAHVLRNAPKIRMHCRFNSSHNALLGLGAGHAHVAGTHLHNRRPGEANVKAARTLLGGMKAKVIAFSLMEEGLMVAPGNPHGIRDVNDLANGRVRLINRESGAALRTLLDDYLDKFGIPKTDVTGYENEVQSHLEGAQMVAFGSADAALGFRAVANACKLDFVPIQVVRCDLVVPKDMIDHPSIQILLDTLQSGKFRQELGSLPGYESSHTGSAIAEL